MGQRVEKERIATEAVTADLLFWVVGHPVALEFTEATDPGLDPARVLVNEPLDDRRGSVVHVLCLDLPSHRVGVFGHRLSVAGEEGVDRAEAVVDDGLLGVAVRIPSWEGIDLVANGVEELGVVYQGRAPKGAPQAGGARGPVLARFLPSLDDAVEGCPGSASERLLRVVLLEEKTRDREEFDLTSELSFQVGDPLSGQPLAVEQALVARYFLATRLQPVPET